MQRKITGFTLIELLMAVSILGLLLALVIPGLQQTLRQAHRSEAISLLLAVANHQQQNRAQSGSFTDTLAADSSAPEGYRLTLATDTTGAMNLPNASALAQLSCSSTPCFILAATTQGRQTADSDCALFTFDHLGRKRSYRADGSQNTPGTTDPCW